jgi:hypothetical protein
VKQGGILNSPNRFPCFQYMISRISLYVHSQYIHPQDLCFVHWIWMSIDVLALVLSPLTSHRLRSTSIAHTPRSPKGRLHQRVQQKCTGPEVQKCRSAEVQKCRSAEVQKCRSAEVQKCRSAEVQEVPKQLSAEQTSPSLSVDAIELTRSVDG